jgi:hypothetical protein
MIAIEGRELIDQGSAEAGLEKALDDNVAEWLRR